MNDTSDPLKTNRLLTPQTHSTRARIKRIWIGNEGLRSGWSALLFVLIFGAVLGIVLFVSHLFHHHRPVATEVTPRMMIVGELALIFAGLIATKVMSLIEKRSWLAYGLAAPHRARHLGQGAFWGVVMMSATIALLWLCHAVTIERSAIQIGPLIQFALLWALAFALVALGEEVAFRGYVFFLLARRNRPVKAALITSAVFALVHFANPAETVAGILAAAAAGLVICLAIWRTGSLWWAMGFHAAWDWSQSFLFGVADSGELAAGHWLTSQPHGPSWLSGGSVGPEGSLLLLPVLALTALVIVRTLPASETAQTAFK